MTAQTEIRAIPPAADDPLTVFLGQTMIVYLKGEQGKPGTYLWGPLKGRPEGFGNSAEELDRRNPAIVMIDGEPREFDLDRFSSLPWHDSLGEVSFISDETVKAARAFIAAQLEEVLSDPNRPSYSWADDPEALIAAFLGGAPLPASSNLENIIAVRLSKALRAEEREERFGVDHLQSKYLISLFFALPPSWPANLYKEMREAEQDFDERCRTVANRELLGALYRDRGDSQSNGRPKGAAKVRAKALAEAKRERDRAEARLKAARAALDY